MIKWQVILHQRRFQALVVTLMFGIIYYHKVSSSSYSKSSLKGSSSYEQVLPLEARGAVIGETELFYMLPKKKTVGILVFFHGCNHAGQDMFRLPEDRIVAQRALDRGLAVLSPTSINRKSGCWSKRDIETIQSERVFEQWLQKVNLGPELPRMGMGASSGGNILFMAHNAFSFRSIVSYIMASGFSQFDWERRSEINPLPSVGYVHMPKDSKRAEKIPALVAQLEEENIPTQTWEVLPHALTSEVCQQRIPELHGRCGAIIRYIQDNYEDLLDKDGNVLEPYTSEKWESLFVKSKLDPDNFEKTKQRAEKAGKGSLIGVQFSGHSWLWAALVEEIAVSYGKHEMTAEHAESVLDFLMKNAGIEI